MDISYAEKLLDILIANSSRILRAGFGVNYAEPALFAVIDLLIENPSLKEYFLSRVLHTFCLDDPSSLRGGAVPVELIELVAHELRWDEIRIIAEDRIRKVFSGDYNLTVGDISQRIIEAFDDCWPDKEFYKHYHSDW